MKKDLCGCHSGKQYKNCCQKYVRFTIKDKFLKDNVRPDIQFDHQGRKCVVIGNRVLILPSWCKTFHDFLFVYMQEIIKDTWADAETKKEPQDRHPLIKWNSALSDFLKSNILERSQPITATGAVAAYISLAYNLYLMEHHGLLQKDLLNRLKNHQQFQGAYYEIYVIANFIRGGFDIEYENETDGSTSHCEFVATCKIDGKKFSVEAKSKHRSGILGQSGKKNKEETKIAIHNLLVKALKKEARYRRVIIIDVNMPPQESAAKQLEDLTWLDDVCQTIEKKESISIQGKKTPPAYIVFTNRPYDWVELEDVDPPKQIVGTSFNIPELMADKFNPSAKYKHRHFFKIWDSFRTYSPPDAFKNAGSQNRSFTFLYKVYSKSSKEVLLKLMESSSNINFYNKMTQEELAFVYCEALEYSMKRNN